MNLKTTTSTISTSGMNYRIGGNQMKVANTVDDLKKITGLSSEGLFGIKSPASYTCPKINDLISNTNTNFKFAKRCIESGDYDDGIYYAELMRDDTVETVEDIRTKMGNVREWGEEWKDLAKNLFNALMSVERESLSVFLSEKAMQKLEDINHDNS